MNEQMKPFYVGHKKGQRIYGIRSKGAISLREDRPWYKGFFWVDGRNTNYLWDKDGRYMLKNYGYRRLK